MKEKKTKSKNRYGVSKQLSVSKIDKVPHGSFSSTKALDLQQNYIDRYNHKVIEDKP